MRRGAGVGIGQPSEPRNIAGQFDDAPVVDVVQHDLALGDPAAASWLLRNSALYRCRGGGNTVRPPLPGDTPVFVNDRSNGDKMDAIIKPLRGSKGSDAKAQELKELK